MKKFLLPVLAALIGFSSCSEDFEVAAPYKQITVVYGLLDVRNDAQYIRVQKAFMDQERSAIVMAREADSSFYQNLRVEIREINGTRVTTFPEDLQRVDLASEGFPKDTGAFFNTPSYAYKTVQPLVPGRRYRLVITNKSTNRVDSAETEVIDSAGVRIIGLNPLLVPINFSDRSRTLNLPQRFDPFPVEAKMMEAVMRFHVIERNTNTGVETEKTYDFNFASIDSTNTEDFSPPNNVRLRTPNSNFYTFLAGALGPAPAGVERYLDSPDVIIHMGTGNMLRYKLFNNASGGLTGDQVRPLYTNIQSSDASALGLFAARTTYVALEVPISKIVVDSLNAYPETQVLKIVGIAGR